MDVDTDRKVEGDQELENAMRLERSRQDREASGRMVDLPARKSGESKDAISLRALIPGTELKVWLDDERYVVVTAYPPSWKHVKKYSAVITKTIELAAREYTAGVAAGVSGKKLDEKIGRALVPVILNEGFSLVEECLRVSPGDFPIDELPADAIPVVIEAWITESFGSEIRRRPWVEVMDRLKALFAARKIDSTSATPSTPSSKAATP